MKSCDRTRHPEQAERPGTRLRVMQGSPDPSDIWLLEILRGVPLRMTMIVGILSSGCCPQQIKHPYEGPTDPIARVIDDINQNNQGIRTIWSRGDFKAWIPDDKGRVHFVDGEAHLMYQSAADLRVIGNKFGVGRVFDIGSNGKQYWLTVKPEIDTMWYGDYQHASAAGAPQMPIRPDLLLEILGVGEIETDLTRQPVPVMRFNNDEDAYMLVWHVKSTTPPERWIAQKEVWYDRASKHPKLVLLFDEDGRIVLRAYLSEHKPIQNESAGSKPVIASRFDLYFPQSKTKMQLSLDEIVARHDELPSDKSFAFPGLNAAEKIINIDEAHRD